MKKVFYMTLISSFLSLLPTTVLAQAVIVSQDGAFLGILNKNRFDDKSICNQFGDYGSRFGNGIFNRFGDYGGQFSEMGAYNPSAQKPPALLVNGQIVGFISKNPRVPNRVDPDLLQMQCGQ